MEANKKIIAAAAVVIIAAAVFFAGSILFEGREAPEKDPEKTEEKLTATSEELSENLSDEFSKAAEKESKKERPADSTSLEGTCWSTEGNDPKSIVVFSADERGEKYALFYVSEKGRLTRTASYKYKETDGRLIFRDINSDDIINKYPLRKSRGYIKLDETIYRQDDFNRYDNEGE